MKKSIILSILFIISLTSCERISPVTKPEEGSEEQKGSAPSIYSISRSDILLYPAECDLPETVSLKIKDADEVSSSAASSLKVEIKQEEGESYTVTIRALSAVFQTASVAIIARNAQGEDRRSISVTAASLSIDRDSFSAPVAGATLSVGFRSNVGLKASPDQSCSSWVHVGPADDRNVSVTIDRNTTFESRSGIVTFTDSKGLLSCRFSVSQDAAPNYSLLEREALCALYNSTDGQHWQQFSSSVGGLDISTANWATDKPLDQWYGVETNSDGRVVRLHLNEMGLVGTLPDNIGNLIYCQELWLSGNKLSGELPASIGDMQSLKDLSASGNSFSGELSASTLSKIAPRLKNLSLSDNMFTGGFPEWVSIMPESCNFWLQGNCLFGKVPASVQEHPAWSRVVLDGSGKTVGEVNLQQREGYTLSVE